jgi:hypothetical protein
LAPGRKTTVPVPAGEDAEGKEGTEGIFYHKDTENTEFRIKTGIKI